MSLVPSRRAEDLERFLGSPFDALSPLGFEATVARDEREEFPAEACARLDEWGWPACLVPPDLGGDGISLEELAQLLRVVARRDLAVAMSHGMISLMAALPVWLAGDCSQRDVVAKQILRGAQLAVGFNERDNGNDLLATSLRATEDGPGWHLHGEKWIVNNARRAAAATVFARTGDAGGPRGFSLFLIEPGRLDPATWRHLPRIETVGIRSCDISGWSFDRCRLPAEALIGGRGLGLEVALKAFQVTRTLIPALALGSADTALRCTLDFALRRRLYGGSVFEIPHARTTLSVAWIDLTIAECVLLTATRALHVVPEQAAMWSAVAKAWIAEEAAQVVRDLSVILGARHYVREGHWSGVFQKILRDVPVVGLGHGSTWVCLSGLAEQIGPGAGTGAQGEPAERLARIFDPDAALPELALDRLELTSRGRNDVIDGLPRALELLEERAGAADPAVADELRALGRKFAEEHRSVLDAGHRAQRAPRSRESALQRFDLGRRYCRLHAAAACLHLWLQGGGVVGELFGSGQWLAVALARILGTASPGSLEGTRLLAPVTGELLRLHGEGRLCSFVPSRSGEPNAGRPTEMAVGG